MRSIEIKQQSDSTLTLIVYDPKASGADPVNAHIELHRAEWDLVIDMIQGIKEAEAERVAQRWGRIAAVLWGKNPNDVSQHPWAASMRPEQVEAVDGLIALYEAGGFEFDYVPPNTETEEYLEQLVSRGREYPTEETT